MRSMKWWGWLTIAISGTIAWTGIGLIFKGLRWRPFGDGEAVYIGGIIIILAVCAALPLIFKAIKSAEDGDRRPPLVL